MPITSLRAYVHSFENPVHDLCLEILGIANDVRFEVPGQHVLFLFGFLEVEHLILLQLWNGDVNVRPVR